VILGGLGDEMESVREVALKAGQVILYCIIFVCS